MLTEIAIKNIPVLEKRREVPDGKITGLYLIVQPSGAKSWALRYRAAGAPRKLTIGPYPAIDIGKARRRAQEALGEIAGGKDPAATKRGARTAGKAEREADVDRVERVVALLIERHVKPKTRDWRETERILFTATTARWRGRRLSQITRAHVHEMLDGLFARGRVSGESASSPTSGTGASMGSTTARRMTRWNRAMGSTSPLPERLGDRGSFRRRNRFRRGRAFERLGWWFRLDRAMAASDGVPTRRDCADGAGTRTRPKCSRTLSLPALWNEEAVMMKDVSPSGICRYVHHWRTDANWWSCKVCVLDTHHGFQVDLQTPALSSW